MRPTLEATKERMVAAHVNSVRAKRRDRMARQRMGEHSMEAMNIEISDRALMHEISDEEILRAVAFELERQDEQGIDEELLYIEDELHYEQDFGPSSDPNEGNTGDILCPLCFKQTMSLKDDPSYAPLSVLCCPCGVHVATIATSGDDVKSHLSSIFDQHAQYCSARPRQEWEPPVGSLVFSCHEGRLLFDCSSCRSKGQAIGPN